MPWTVSRLVSAALALAAAGPALAQGAPPAAGGPSPAPAGASVYFVDLKNGAVIPPSSVVHFGLRGMGVAPAGVQKDAAGHHHLLVDADLPPLDKPIPNDANHLHFGAGQTEATLELAPGEHTLQLLLADHKHIPHTPPVLSDRIKVVVREGETGGERKSVQRRPSPAGARVYIASPADGSYVPRNVPIRFGLVNMGVAPAGFAKPNTGHHHLLIDTDLPPLDKPIPNDASHLHFGAGQTEATVALPLGTHRLRLLLADENHVAHDPPVASKPITVTVTASGRPPRARKVRHGRGHRRG